MSRRFYIQSSFQRTDDFEFAAVYRPKAASYPKQTKGIGNLQSGSKVAAQNYFRPKCQKV
jgi:hypothetical protein